MTTVMMVHGSYATKDDNWYPGVKKDLELSSFSVICQDYPTDYDIVKAMDIQNYDAWAKTMDKYKNKIDEQTIFIGHSISCVFFVKYCMEHNIHTRACVFVSGFNNYRDEYTDFIKSSKAESIFDKAMNTFYVSDKTLKSFRNMSDDIYCIYSQNDPIVSQKSLVDFADKLDAQKVIVKEGGHFCEGEYKTNFPLITEIVNALQKADTNTSTLTMSK